MPARNVVSNGIPNSKVRYSRLASDDDGYIDLQVRLGVDVVSMYFI